MFPPGFSGISHLPTIGLELNLDLILSGSGSAWKQEGSHLYVGRLLETLKVSTHTVSTWIQWHMGTKGSMAHGTTPPWARFCWEWGPRRIRGGLELNQDYWGLDSVEHNM